MITGIGTVETNTVASGEPSVFIVILNWNGWQDTRECLHSLGKISYSNGKVVLIDNGSTDESLTRLRTEFPHIEPISTGENLGFSAGSNAGIQYALDHKADYIMLLNNDTLVSPDFIQPLVESLKNGWDVVVPLIFYADRPNEIWFADSHIDWKQGWPHHVQPKRNEKGELQPFIEPEYATGCCLTASAEVWRQVGMMDPQFFAYFEDADWSVRAKALSLRIATVSKSNIWHKVSRAPLENSVGTFLFVRNGLLFINKHSRKRRLETYLQFVKEWVARPILRELLHNRFTWKMAFARIRGVYWHLRNRYGTPYS